MRALFFILGLAFVAAVPIASVNALRHCYYRDTNSTDSDWKDATCKENVTYCSTLNGTDGRVIWSCGDTELCNSNYTGIVVTCCNSGDFCNADPFGRNTPPPARNTSPPARNTPTIDSNALKSHDKKHSGGSTTSAPPVPLFIAVFTGVMAAIGI